MKIKQLSVFLGNKKGRLARLTELLAQHHVNIRSLCIAETEDYGVLRMLVDTPEKTVELLKNNDYVCELTDVFAIEVPDIPGGLHHILAIFEQNDLNVEYMYAFVEKKHDNAIMIFKFEEIEKVAEIADTNNITLVSAHKLLSEL